MRFAFDNNHVKLIRDNSPTFPTVSVSEMANVIFHTNPLVTNPDSEYPIFPDSLRYMSSDGTTFVIERPPCTIGLSYRGGRPSQLERPPSERYQLSFPWQIYLIDTKASTIRVYFRNSALESLDDELLLPPLSNVDYSGGTCLGSQHQMAVSNFPQGPFSIHTLMDVMVNEFWMNEFNDDMKIVWNCLPEEMRRHPDILQAAIDNPQNELAIRHLGINSEDIVSENLDTCPYVGSIIVPGPMVYGFLASLSEEETLQINWHPVANEECNSISKILNMYSMVDRRAFCTSNNLYNFLANSMNKARLGHTRSLYENEFSDNEDSFPDQDPEYPEDEDTERNPFEDILSRINRIRYDHGQVLGTAPPVLPGFNPTYMEIAPPPLYGNLAGNQVRINVVPTTTLTTNIIWGTTETTADAIYENWITDDRAQEVREEMERE